MSRYAQNFDWYCMSVEYLLKTFQLIYCIMSCRTLEKQINTQLENIFGIKDEFSFHYSPLSNLGRMEKHLEKNIINQSLHEMELNQVVCCCCCFHGKFFTAQTAPN